MDVNMWGCISVYRCVGGCESECMTCGGVSVCVWVVVLAGQEAEVTRSYSQ